MNSNTKMPFITWIIAITFAAILAGCGAGKPLPGTGAAPVNGVTGVAATGAPIFGTVSLKDASTPANVLTTSTASDGTFIFDTAKLKAPFILKVSSGANTYYSISTEGSGTTNINPLTTVVVSMAAGGGDLNAFYNAWYAPGSAAAVLNLPTADVALQTALAPVLSQFGVTGNIINANYVANHTGADAMLDVIGISVSATGTVTLTNKANASVIFTAPTSNIASGTVVAANIPAVPVQTLGAVLYGSNCAKCHGDINNSSIIGRSSVVKIMGAIASDFGGMSVLGALTPDEIQAISDAIPTQAAPIVPGSLSGATLYANNCAGCHGPLATSTKLGVTIVRLQNAISANAGSTVGSGMGSLSTLSVVDLNAIVVALNPATTTPAPTTLDGATIYATNCSGCHGPLATTTKTGLTVARFYAATVTNSAVTGMGYLSSLSMAEVQALISALPAPVTAGASAGQVAYETNCAGCHGPFATSSKAGATVTRINAAITANTGGMGVFSTLTQTQVSDIATALGTVVVAPPPGTPVGQTLYGTYCSGCHGPFATSTKAGPTMTVARLQAGITANPTQMGALATSLTAQNMTDIAAQLATLPAPVLDGPGLYAANCGSCHTKQVAITVPPTPPLAQVVANSTKGGATAAKIQQEINNKRGSVAGVGGMAGANLAALTTTQIGLIAAALAPIAPPACGSCHAVALASLTSGQHVFHGTSNKITGAIKTALFAPSTTSCGICHGTGYTTTSNGNMLTHNDGTKNIAINPAANSTTIFGIKTWVAPKTTPTVTKGSCTPGCHGTKSW